MKTICYRFVFAGFLLVYFLLAAQPLKAQNDELTTPYKRVLKIRPLQFGEYYASWENIKHDDQSNELGIGFIYKSFVGATEKDKNTLNGFYSSFLNEEDYAISKTAGIVVRMSQRNYSSKTKDIPEGFYYGPVYMYRFIAYDPDLLRTVENEVIGRMYEHVLSFHYQIGYQFIFGKHLTFEPFFGAGFRGKLAKAQISKGRTEERVIGPIKITPDDNTTIAAAPSLQLNFSIGYVF
jgi:hypothetical protein